MERKIIKAKDGYRLCLHIFEVKDPKGYVQVIHGMEEHQERYERLAERLNTAGYTVITSDMRGHGQTAPILGYFGEKKGWYYLLMDQVRITSYIKYRFSAEKVILFAHSMGTIIARNLLQTQSEHYEKVVLSGYPFANPAAGFGILLTGILQKCKGGAYFSPLIQKMAIGSFNRKIPDHTTDLDWISMNEDNVQEFKEDPYCGHGFRIAGFRDLFRLVRRMSDSRLYRNVQKDLPILAVRGEEDPCTGGDKGCASSLLNLQKAGFTHISSISYPGMRHEILNEKNNEQVYSDILHFLG